MSDCVTILSSDNEVTIVEDFSKAEPESNQNEKTPIKRKIPLTAAPTGKDVFVKSIDSSDDMKRITRKLWKKFDAADSLYIKSSNFITLVEKALTKVVSEPYSQLKIIGDELTYNKVTTKHENENLSIEPSTSRIVQNVENEEPKIDSKTAQHISKLEKMLLVLHRRIQRLEIAEVDLSSSDEENSAYIQVSRYKERYCQVFNKLCELQKKNSIVKDKLLSRKIKFTGSGIICVDRAIEKFYNDRKEFPDYQDILKVVQKANEIKNLNLNPRQVKETAEKAFLEFGKSLKTVRQYDDYEVFSTYITHEEDPASKDSYLQQKLDENKKKFGNRIDEVIDKYALKQYEENIQPEVVNSDDPSEASDDDDEEEDTDNHSKDSIMEIKSDVSDNIETSSSQNRIECKVALFDVKHSAEWNYYMNRQNGVQPSNSRKHSFASLNELNPKRRKINDDDEEVETISIDLDDGQFISSKTDDRTTHISTKDLPITKEIIETENENDVIDICSDSCDKINESDDMVKSVEDSSIFESKIIINENDSKSSHKKESLPSVDEKPEDKIDNDDVVIIDEVKSVETPGKKKKFLSRPQNSIDLTKVIRDMKFESKIFPKNSSQKSTATLNRRIDPRYQIFSHRDNPGTSKQIISVSNNVNEKNNANQNLQNTKNRTAPAFQNTMHRPVLLNKGKNLQYLLNSNRSNMNRVNMATAMQKTQRTTTMQQQTFDCRTNSYITRKQVTTVVEESVMSMNRSQVQISGNRNVQTLSQRTRVIKQMQQISNVRKPNNNVSDEVITLD